MEKIAPKIGDCFLMKGLTINEPMTLYYITDINGDKIQALSIYVHDKMVQGLDVANEYDDEIPTDAILLPEGTYDRVKESMNKFVEETTSYLQAHCNRKGFKVRIGGHYWDRHIETITEINGNKTKYDLFRFETENISPIGLARGLLIDLKAMGLRLQTMRLTKSNTVIVYM
ncbi:MAG: hypothetical protein IJ764_02440 [Bacteroidales bacterium]|nr:hypothetical protein [Bacteroidales bacterium]